MNSDKDLMDNDLWYQELQDELDNVWWHQQELELQQQEIENAKCKFSR